MCQKVYIKFLLLSNIKRIKTTKERELLCILEYLVIIQTLKCRFSHNYFTIILLSVYLVERTSSF